MRELKENIHIQTVAKLLIAVAAIAHLIFTYVHTALCAATVGMGADLVSIYQTAIRTQNSLEPAMVYKAVWFSLALMAIFALSGVLLLIDTCRKHTER